MTRVSWRINPLALIVLVWLGIVLYAGFQQSGIWIEIGIIAASGGALVLGLHWLEKRHRRTWVIHTFSFLTALLSTALYYLVKSEMPHMEFLFTLTVIAISVRLGLGAGLVAASVSFLGDLSVGWIYGPTLISEIVMQGIFLFVAALVVGSVAETREKALAAQTRLAQENTRQAESLAQLVKQLEHTYQSTLSALGSALDARDHETAGHSARVTALAVKIAKRFGLKDSQLKFIRWGALIHDIGKIGVADAILRKPGALNDAEWVEMRRHPEIGYAMLKNILFLRPALDLVRHHHERYDGKGYPLGLVGETIPLAARIFAVADTYDAMTSDRPYRKARSHEDAMAEIRQLAGAQFDPRVVAAFLEVFPESLKPIGVVMTRHSADDFLAAR